MIVIFFLYFSIRAVKLYNDLTSNFSRILLGSCVAGIGTGLLTGFLLWCVFPTYYFIEAPRSDGYYTRYVLDENFTNHFGTHYNVKGAFFSNSCDIKRLDVSKYMFYPSKANICSADNPISFYDFFKYINSLCVTINDYKLLMGIQ